MDSAEFLRKDQGHQRQFNDSMMSWMVTHASAPGFWHSSHSDALAARRVRRPLTLQPVAVFVVSSAAPVACAHRRVSLLPPAAPVAAVPPAPLFLSTALSNASPAPRVPRSLHRTPTSADPSRPAHAASPSAPAVYRIFPDASPSAVRRASSAATHGADPLPPTVVRLLGSKWPGGCVSTLGAQLTQSSYGPLFFLLVLTGLVFLLSAVLSLEKTSPTSASACRPTCLSFFPVRPISVSHFVALRLLVVLVIALLLFLHVNFCVDNPSFLQSSTRYSASVTILMCPEAS